MATGLNMANTTTRRFERQVELGDNGARNSHIRADEFLQQRFPHGIQRVLFVNPPDADESLFQYDTAKRGRYSNYPPYGLGVLAQHLRAIDIRVDIVNLNHEVLKACYHSENPSQFEFNSIWHSCLDKAIKRFKPHLITVTCMFTMTHDSLKQVCAYVSQCGISIAIGGVHVSNDVERVLDDIPQAHMAFVREGDSALPAFIQVVNRQSTVQTLGQVILNDGLQRYRYLQSCQPSAEVTNVCPAYDLMCIQEYAKYGVIGAFYCFKPKHTVFATVLSNRGCRAQCTFCSVRNFNGVGVRQRSVASVVDELQCLEQEYGVGHIMWLDDDLFKDQKRTIALFNEKVKRGLKMTWDATNGVIAAACTEDIIAAAAESGCIAINIGMESGNEKILRDVRKPGTIKNFLKAADILRRYAQIHSSVFLMIGFPGETLRMIQDTIRVAQEMDMDWYRISQLQPLPNTPIYDAMIKQGLIVPSDASEVRFMGGAYGKQQQIESHTGCLETQRFIDAFADIPLDGVPNQHQLTDIWFYMNYHLNFHRLFHEQRAVKIEQMFAHLGAISDLIAPENGFALYFLGYLQHQVNGHIAADIIQRLRLRIATSAYWADRLQAFGLSLDDLINADFPNRDLAGIAHG